VGSPESSIILKASYVACEVVGAQRFSIITDGAVRASEEKEKSDNNAYVKIRGRGC
jgi:hypothetical protein